MATLADDKQKFGKCRCCLAEGRHRDLRLSYEDLKLTTEIECYSELFFDCFKFSLLLDDITTLICWDCIEKLKGAFEFKNNVMKSTTQLLIISVTNQKITENKTSITNGEKDKNGNFKEISANVVHSESNEHETDNIKITENAADPTKTDDLKPPTNNVLTETDGNISKAFKSVPDVVAKKCKNMILNGIKVTIVKCDKEGAEIESKPGDELRDTELKIPEIKQNGMPAEGKCNTVLPIKAKNEKKQSPNHENSLSPDTSLNINEVCKETVLKPTRQTRKRKNIETVYKPDEDEDLSPPDPYEDSGDEKDWSPSKTCSETAESGKDRERSPSPKRQRRHTIKSKEKEGKRRKKREEEAERQKEADKMPWPIPLRSYSGRKQKQLNKIQVSEPFSIKKSPFQNLDKNGEANTSETDDSKEKAAEINKKTETSPTIDASSRHITNGDPGTVSPTEQSKIDLNNANHNINDQFVDKTLLKPERATCDPGMLPLPAVGSLSFAARQFDSLNTPIATLLATRELVRVEHKRILVAAADVQTPKPKTSKENKPWRLDQQNDDLNNESEAPKDKASEKQTNNSVKEITNITGSNKNPIPNKLLGQNEEDEEEIKARRLKLLSGYVRKTVKVDQNIYKEHMKELLRREETVAYRCKKCGSLYLSEFSLLEHKKTHEQEDLQQDDVKQDLPANGQSKKASNKKEIAKLSIAPGVKEVLNPMYKMNNDPNIEGPMIIYASGNCFYKSSTTPDSRIVWVCKTHHHCVATLHTRGDEIVDYNNNHTPRLSTPFKIVTAASKEIKQKNRSHKKTDETKNKTAADGKTKAMKPKNVPDAKTNIKKRKNGSDETENEMKNKNGCDENTNVQKRRTRSDVKTAVIKNEYDSGIMEHNGCDGQTKVMKRKRVSGGKTGTMERKNGPDEKITPKKDTPKRTYSKVKKEIVIKNESLSENNIKTEESEKPSIKNKPKRESRKNPKKNQADTSNKTEENKETTHQVMNVIKESTDDPNMHGEENKNCSQVMNI